jgi:hypothetical protein
MPPPVPAAAIFSLPINGISPAPGQHHIAPFRPPCAVLTHPGVTAETHRPLNPPLSFLHRFDPRA